MVLNKQLLLLFTIAFISFPPTLGLAQNLKATAEREVRSTLPIDETPEKNKNFLRNEVPSIATVRAQVVPQPELKKSAWVFALGTQSMSMQGNINLDFIKRQDLSNLGPLRVWYFELGRSFSASSWPKTWMVSFRGGGAQEQNFITTTGGQSVSDTRLQVYLASLQAQLLFPLGAGFSLGPEMALGLVNLTQVSSNSSARFSKSRSFWSPGLNLHYELIENLKTSLIYERRNFISPGEFLPQTDNWLVELSYSL